MMEEINSSVIMGDCNLQK